MTRKSMIMLALSLFLAACEDDPTPEIADQALYARGEIVFERFCASCHEVEARAHKVGPHLVGLMGRRAGSPSGFVYSPAMREFGLEWDADTLEAFLVDPPTTVPGTKMVIEPVADPAERAAVIYYLTQQ